MLFKRGEHMSSKRDLLDRFAEQMDLTGEPVPGESIVELGGDRRLLIENHFGITQYSREKICVKVKCGIIAVCGCDLELSQMTRQQLVICGRIDTLSIARRKCK